MARFSSADELVTLPRMGGADAIALGTILEAAATEAKSAIAPQPLPQMIARKLERMLTTRDSVAEVMRGRLQPVGSDTPQAAAADRVLDAAWSGTRDFCQAFGKLPRRADTAALIDSALVLTDTLFKNGLGFTGLKYRAQWVESKTRLDLIAERSLGAHFDRLGGRVFLTELITAHDVYGKALGLTEYTPESDASLRAALTEFQTVLRRYILGVTGYADPDIQGSEKLAELLLAPLNSWEPAPTTTAAADVDGDGGADDGADDGADGDGADGDGADADADAGADAGADA